MEKLTFKSMIVEMVGGRGLRLALAFLLVLIVSGPVFAQTAAQAGPSLLLGAAWYPEQWPESRWDEELRLMEQAHLRVVRVGEFAWSRMESAEGHYDLDWLERAVRLAERHHVAVVLGTPTDTPPAWLTAAHPETLREDASGHRAEHGERRQFNLPIRSIVSIARRSPGNWRGVSVTIPMSSAGRLAMSTATSPSTRKLSGSSRIGSNSVSAHSTR